MRAKGRALGKPGKLEGIQFCRGLAAILVVFYHAGRMLSLPQYIGHIALGGIFNFGNAGVDFFFTLSGFIIYFVHHRDIGNIQRLPRYVWNRATRIYPIYWFVTLIVVAMLFAKHDAQSLAFEHVIASWFLLPSNEWPILGVGWTLVHEVFFYTTFALAITSRFAARLVTALWAALIVTGFIWQPASPMIAFFVSPYHVQFALGALTAYFVLRGNVSMPSTYIFAGINIFVICAVGIDGGYVTYNPAFMRLLFGIASALVIFGTAKAEMQGSLSVSKSASFLGAASYSIYLLHVIAVGVLAKALGYAALEQRYPNLSLVVISIAAIAMGCILYATVEQPVMRAAKSLSRSRSTDTPPT